LRAIYVPLSDSTLAALTRVARSKRRHPKDQAALILEEALQDSDRGPPATHGARVDSDSEQSDAAR
jgi:hypothetical protein